MPLRRRLCLLALVAALFGALGALPCGGGFAAGALAVAAPCCPAGDAEAGHGGDGSCPCSPAPALLGAATALPTAPVARLQPARAFVPRSLAHPPGRPVPIA